MRVHKIIAIEAGGSISPRPASMMAMRAAAMDSTPVQAGEVDPQRQCHGDVRTARSQQSCAQQALNTAARGQFFPIPEENGTWTRNTSPRGDKGVVARSKTLGQPATKSRRPKALPTRWRLRAKARRREEVPNQYASLRV